MPLNSKCLNHRIKILIKKEKKEHLGKDQINMIDKMKGHQEEDSLNHLKSDMVAF